MQPIANPEDMTPEERARIYGTPAPHRPHHHRRENRHARTRPARTAKPEGDRARTVTGVARAGSKAQTTTKTAAKPQDARPSPAPAKPAVIPATPKPPAPALVVQAPQSAASKTGVGGFPHAIAGDVAAGLKLTIPPLRLAQPTIVTLNLPAAMFAQLQTEARRHGMENAARMISVQSTLSADKFDIRPMGPQSVMMGPDEATTFNWAVTPKVIGAAVFKTRIEVVFKGSAAPQTVAVEFNTSVGTRPDGPVSSPAASARADHASILSSAKSAAQTAASKTGLMVFGLLGVLLLVALAALSRRTKRGSS